VTGAPAPTGKRASRCTPTRRSLGTSCGCLPARSRTPRRSCIHRNAGATGAAELRATRQPMSTRQPQCRDDFLYDIKGGGLRPPPAPATGGRKRPSSPAPRTRRAARRPRTVPPRTPGPLAERLPRPAHQRALSPRLMPRAASSPRSSAADRPYRERGRCRRGCQQTAPCVAEQKSRAALSLVARSGRLPRGSRDARWSRSSSVNGTPPLSGDLRGHAVFASVRFGRSACVASQHITDAVGPPPDLLGGHALVGGVDEFHEVELGW
jgi:hypothetical protein